MTSPMPARPAKVSGLAPAATPRRVISARPRVMRPALPLSPKPSCSAAPAAMATMFLSAPHSSTPDDVAVAVEPERARLPSMLDRPARSTASSSAPTTELAGQPARDLGRQVRAGQRRHARRRTRDHLARSPRSCAAASRARCPWRPTAGHVIRRRSSADAPGDRAHGGRGHGQDDQLVGVGEQPLIGRDLDLRPGASRRAGSARSRASAMSAAAWSASRASSVTGPRPGEHAARASCPTRRRRRRPRGAAAHQRPARGARHGSWRLRLPLEPLVGAARFWRLRLPLHPRALAEDRAGCGVPPKPNASRSRFSR